MLYLVFDDYIDFSLQNQVENGFIQFCIYVLTWLLMYKLGAIIVLWITIAFFLQSFSFVLQVLPLLSVLEIETKILFMIARHTLYHTLVCKVKDKTKKQVLSSVPEIETKILCIIARHTLYHSLVCISSYNKCLKTYSHIAYF